MTYMAGQCTGVVIQQAMCSPSLLTTSSSWMQDESFSLPNLKTNTRSSVVLMTSSTSRLDDSVGSKYAELILTLLLMVHFSFSTACSVLSSFVLLLLLGWLFFFILLKKILQPRFNLHTDLPCQNNTRLKLGITYVTKQWKISDSAIRIALLRSAWNTAGIYMEHPSWFYPRNNKITRQ